MEMAGCTETKGKGVAIARLHAYTAVAIVTGIAHSLTVFHVAVDVIVPML